MRINVFTRRCRPCQTTLRSVRCEILVITALIAALTGGCAFDYHKQVEVLSDPPGARIEINGDFVGVAPVVITMIGKSNDEVEQDYVIRAYPAAPEFYPQVKAFLKNTQGADQIPTRIFFDMRVRQPADNSTAPESATKPRPWP